jgi:hypothetical protein
MGYFGMLANNSLYQSCVVRFRWTAQQDMECNANCPALVSTQLAKDCDASAAPSANGK